MAEGTGMMGEMTAFERDMGLMVHESDAPEAKKSMAMNFVRNAGRIANGSREDVGRISDTLCSLTPIILEMYLERHACAQDVAEAIEAHVSNCPVNVIRLRGDASVDPLLSGMNWQRFLFTMATKISWPGALLAIAFMFKEPLEKFIMSLAG